MLQDRIKENLNRYLEDQQELPLSLIATIATDITYNPKGKDLDVFVDTDQIKETLLDNTILVRRNGTPVVKSKKFTHSKYILNSLEKIMDLQPNPEQGKVLGYTGSVRNPVKIPYRIKEAMSYLSNQEWVIEPNDQVTLKDVDRTTLKQFNALRSDVPTGKVKFPSVSVDARYRIYLGGYAFKPQGTDEQKYEWKLPLKRRISKEGRTELLRKIASEHPEYKEKLFTHEIRQQLEEDILENNLYISSPEIKYLLDIYQGKSTNSLIGLDARASGIQMFSALAKDIKGLENCGLYAPKDPYSVVNHITDATRKEHKAAVMTAFYQSTKEPLNLYGIDHIDEFWDVLRKEYTGASNVLDISKLLWDDTVLNYILKMDDLTASIPVMKTVSLNFTAEELKLDELGLEGDLTISKRVNMPTSYQRFLAADIAHFCDASVATDVILDCKREGIKVLSVFDCFLVHPNDARKVRTFYLNAIEKLFNSDALNQIVQSITKGKDTITADKIEFPTINVDDCYLLS